MIKKKGFAATPYRGRDHWKFRNGKQRANGYEMIKIPNHPAATSRGYVYEHRLVFRRNRLNIIPSLVLYSKRLSYDQSSELEI